MDQTEIHLLISHRLGETVKLKKDLALYGYGFNTILIFDRAQ